MTMTVPDGAILGVVATLAGYFAYQNKQITQAFFTQMPLLTKTLTDLSSRVENHDVRVAEADRNICESQHEIAQVLREIRRDMHVQIEQINKPVDVRVKEGTL